MSLISYSSRRNFALQQSDKTPTAHQDANITMKGNTLRRRIQKWQDLQRLCMPFLAPLLPVPSNTSSDSSDHPNTLIPPNQLPLCLPSSVVTSQCAKNPDFERFWKIELCLRKAQIEDSLNEVRRHRRVITSLWFFKRKQVAPSQRAGTRMRSTIERFEQKESKCVERYRAAWKALLALDPGGDWSRHFLELRNEDIRGPGRDDDEDSRSKGTTKRATGEGYREASWIWRNVAISEDASSLGDSMYFILFSKTSSHQNQLRCSCRVGKE